jgi:hypothetical protein
VTRSRRGQTRKIDVEKKREELRLVKAFLEHDGWTILHAKNACEPKPDVLADVRRGDEALCLGVEITEYADEKARRLRGAWSDILADMKETLDGDERLRRVWGFVTFVNRTPPPKSAYRALADELVRIALAEIARAGDTALDTRSSGWGPSYPNATLYVREVYLRYGPNLSTSGNAAKPGRSDGSQYGIGHWKRSPRRLRSFRDMIELAPIGSGSCFVRRARSDRLEAWRMCSGPPASQAPTRLR